MYIRQKVEGTVLSDPVTKSSRGTCVNYLKADEACSVTKAAGDVDCTPCAGIFNNVAPAAFQSGFQTGQPALQDLVLSLNKAADFEPLGNVLKVGGEELGEDNTAVCHTPSSFTCRGDELDFDKLVNEGKCDEVVSVKIDNMCDDGPCDNDDNSQACLLAKAKCLVDPETGSMCMPGNENDPCKSCVRTTVGSGNTVTLAPTTLFVDLPVVSSGNAVTFALTTLFVGLASSML